MMINPDESTPIRQHDGRQNALIRLSLVSSSVVKVRFPIMPCLAGDSGFSFTIVQDGLIQPVVLPEIWQEMVANCPLGQRYLLR